MVGDRRLRSAVSVPLCECWVRHVRQECQYIYTSAGGVDWASLRGFHTPKLALLFNFKKINACCEEHIPIFYEQSSYPETNHEIGAPQSLCYILTIIYK
jgi:hypothetical protein